MSKKFFHPIFFFLCIAISTTSSCSTTAKKASTPRIPQLENKGRYILDNSKSIHFTVSGISSGAFMAHQLNVAYSELSEGAASVAGGVYNCSQGQILRAQGLCMKTPASIQLPKLYKDVSKYEAEKKISSTQFLKNKKVLLFHGTLDPVIKAAASQKIAEFYKHYQSQVSWAPTLPSGHGFPSDRGLNECNESKLPWLNKCSTPDKEAFDGAGWILTGLYSNLNPKTYSSNDHVFRVNQKMTRTENSWMSDSGHVYIPKTCSKTSKDCRFHIALHGCLQNPDSVGLQFITQAGYNEWAESNNIVVYYPSVQSGVLNPAGCWDWWGYTGSEFATQNSSQMKSILVTLNHIKQAIDTPSEDLFLIPISMAHETEPAASLPPAANSEGP